MIFLLLGLQVGDLVKSSTMTELLPVAWSGVIIGVVVIVVRAPLEAAA